MKSLYHLSEEVRAELEAAVVDGPTVKLGRELDRALYLRVNKALELMGGRWDRRRRCHVFEDDAADAVALALGTGTVLDARAHFQFFETPPLVASLLVDMADIRARHTVLEPSAGRGAIVRALRDRGIEPVACELWDENRAYLKRLEVTVVGDDFLRTRKKYDRIVANPPFARGQDVTHVTHMVRCLHRGARLVSVMSPSWTFRREAPFVAFRELVYSLKNAWLELDDGSFALSGTNVRTGILMLDVP